MTSSAPSYEAAQTGDLVPMISLVTNVGNRCHFIKDRLMHKVNYKEYLRTNVDKARKKDRSPEDDDSPFNMMFAFMANSDADEEEE
ncbi:hypothetical protein HAX54_006708, partial [Datura stramonium]|nr:hypothetical protein [Datura stramonium]